MSSYVVDSQTINRVIAFMRQDMMGQRDFAYPIEQLKEKAGIDVLDKRYREHLGELMFKLNRAAVDARYGEGDADKHYPEPYVFQELPAPTLAQAYKSLACWHYQCFEGGIPENSLFKLMDDLYDWMAHHIANRTPAVERAEW